MATESVINPVMMNRPVVDTKTGSLTQYGYSLLSGLQIRTGGAVGAVVDVPSLESQIDTAGHWPIEQPVRPVASFSAPETMQPFPQEQAIGEIFQGAGNGELLDMIVWAPRED